MCVQTARFFIPYAFANILFIIGLGGKRMGSSLWRIVYVDKIWISMMTVERLAGEVRSLSLSLRFCGILRDALPPTAGHVSIM